MPCSFCHVEREARVFDLHQHLLRRLGLDVQCSDDLLRDGACQWWRHRQTDLSSAMPLRPVRSEPVRKSMQTRHLTDGDAPIEEVVDGPRTGECTSCAIRTGTERVRYPIGRELEETTDRFDAARERLSKASTDEVRVVCSRTRGEKPGLPVSRVAKVPVVTRLAAHPRRVSRPPAPVIDIRNITVQQFFEALCVWEIAKGISGRGP